MVMNINFGVGRLGRAEISAAATPLADLWRNATLHAGACRSGFGLRENADEQARSGHLSLQHRHKMQ